jgi:GNAT superfamily N-acetyltransferase
MNVSASRATQAIVAGARRLGFRYECYRVLRVPLLGSARLPVPSLPPGFRIAEVAMDDVSRSADPEIRDCDWYGGGDAIGFAVRDPAGRIACLQWLWFGSRYEHAAFWELAASEAASMHLVTLPQYRNLGLATALKQASARAMAERGFTALYSRVWWSNTPSLRVSEKSGWLRVGTTLRIFLPARSAPVDIRW